MEEAGVVDAGLEGFIVQWGLRAEAQALLLSLDPPARLRVLRDFAPRDTTRDVNAVFCKFARTQATKQATEAEHAAATGSALDSGQRDFVLQWGLRAESQALLASMEPELQARVLREFAPRDTSRDVNAVFCKFAHGVLQGGRAGESSDPVGSFVERWSLGADAQQLLSRLSPDAQLKVMQEFAPRDVGRDVNAIFMKFAGGVAAGVPRGSGRGRPVGGSAHDPGDWRAWARAADAAAQPDQEEELGTDAADALLYFAQRWSLSAESQVLLHSLDPQVQAKVMLEFAPRDTTRDVNAIFRKFASGVAQAEQNGEQVNAFIAQWSLREEAQQVLLNLKPPTQQRVMQQFSPRDAVSDANNIFMKFAQGVARQMERPAMQAPREAQHVHREEVQLQYEEETVSLGMRYQPY